MSGILAALIGAAGGFVYTANISGDTSNFNLRNAAVAAGWNQIVPLVALVNISPGIVVSASTTGLYAFDTGVTAYPEGSRLVINSVNAFVLGMGGAGSTGAGGGGAGAVRVNLPTTWDNTGGTIAGGGGGGGGGQTRTFTFGGDSKTPPTVVTGSGGTGGGGRTGRTNSSPNGSLGGAGAGFSGGIQSASGFTAVGGTGGHGGGWGAGGGAGLLASGSGPNEANFGPYGGGGAGACIVGNAWITWLNTGTRLGSIS